ncbi:hypothetical protein J6590_103632, partial [Homalodisca vitripennis]
MDNLRTAVVRTDITEHYNADLTISMLCDTSTSDLSPLTSDFDTTALIYINYALPTESLARVAGPCLRFS